MFSTQKCLILLVSYLIHFVVSRTRIQPCQPTEVMKIFSEPFCQQVYIPVKICSGFCESSEGIDHFETCNQCKIKNVEKIPIDFSCENRPDGAKFFRKFVENAKECACEVCENKVFRDVSESDIDFGKLEENVVVDKKTVDLLGLWLRSRDQYL